MSIFNIKSTYTRVFSFTASVVSWLDSPFLHVQNNRYFTKQWLTEKNNYLIQNLMLFDRFSFSRFLNYANGDVNKIFSERQASSYAPTLSRMVSVWRGRVETSLFWNKKERRYHLLLRNNIKITYSISNGTDSSRCSSCQIRICWSSCSITINIGTRAKIIRIYSSFLFYYYYFLIKGLWSCMKKTQNEYRLSSEKNLKISTGKKIKENLCFSISFPCIKSSL